MIAGNGDEFAQYEPQGVVEPEPMIGETVLTANTDFIAPETPAEVNAQSTPVVTSFLSSLPSTLSYLPFAQSLGFGTGANGANAEAPKNGAKPWKTFLGKLENYSLPHKHYLLPRVKANLTNFMWNYILVLGALFVIFALFSSSFFFLMLLMAALWVYLFYWKQTPLEIGSFKIELKYVGGVMLALMFFLSFGIFGNKILYALLFLGALIFAHATFYISPEETIDFSRPV